MKFKRLGAIGAAMVLCMSSLLTISLPQIALAASGSDTCTWTGSGGNSNFSTAGNWSGCSSAAPVNGDSLVFNVSSLSASASLTNDISNLSLNSITFSGTSTNFYTYTLAGDALSLSGGISDTANAGQTVKLSLTLSASQTFSNPSGNLAIGDPTGTVSTTITVGTNTLTLSGATSGCSATNIYSALSGSGTVTATGASGYTTLNTDSPNFTGTVNDNSGNLIANSGQALGSAAATTNVLSGAALGLGFSSDTTFPENLALTGTGVSGGLGTIVTSDPSPVSCGGGAGGDDSTAATATLSGTVTLNSNATVWTSQDRNAAVTGALSGNYTLSAAVGSNGQLSINSSNNNSQSGNGNQSAPATTVNYTDTSPSTSVIVQNNVTAVVDGTYGDTSVESGGILKGSGTVGALSVYQGGTVAPGHSPGCLTTTGNYNQSGTYQAEIGGTTACTDYDQIIVNGTVQLDDGSTPPNQGILQVSLVNGFQPKAGQTFEIISNKGGSAIVDTFAGLAEGATFKVSGYVFKITYKGGSGNSVDLTVMSVPGAPDTGFALAAAHPLETLLVTLLTAGTLFGLAVKNGRTFSFVRRKASRK